MSSTNLWIFSLRLNVLGVKFDAVAKVWFLLPPYLGYIHTIWPKCSAERSIILPTAIIIQSNEVLKLGFHSAPKEIKSARYCALIYTEIKYLYFNGRVVSISNQNGISLSFQHCLLIRYGLANISHLYKCFGECMFPLFANIICRRYKSCCQRKWSAFY